MVTSGEKIIFGFLGAVTAIVVSLAVFSNDTNVRSPASQDGQAKPAYEAPGYLYPYYFD